MLRFSLFALLAQAAAEDLNIDLRLLAANSTGNGTAANSTGNGTADPAANKTLPAPAKPANETGDKPVGDGDAIGANATKISTDFQVPQVFDLGLGANATTKQKEAAVNVLCTNAKFKESQQKSMFDIMKGTLDGLLTSHLTFGKCDMGAERLRQLAAAAGSTVAVNTQFRISAPKTAKFAKTLEANKGTDSINDILAKEVVAKLTKSGGDLAAGMAAAMNAAAADPAFKTALAAQPLLVALADAIVKATKDVTAASVTVKTDDIKAQGAGSAKAIQKADTVGYTPKGAPAASTTSGAASAAVAALVAVVSSSLLF